MRRRKFEVVIKPAAREPVFDLTEANRKVEAIVDVHPLAALGDGLKPFYRSIAIMRHLGRYSCLMQGDHKVNLLDDRPATPGRFLAEANVVLKAHGLPQIGGWECRT